MHLDWPNNVRVWSMYEVVKFSLRFSNNTNKQIHWRQECRHKHSSSSATAERPRDAYDFKGVGHFEAKFQAKWLSFAKMSMDR